MTTKSYLMLEVSFKMPAIGSPARITICGETLSARSKFACASSASRNGCSSAGSSAIPSSVVSARAARASMPPMRVASSAAGLPSLQIKIFMSILQLVSGEECVNNDCGADQRQRHKGEPDFRSRKILGRNRADLRADRRAGVHHERDQNIDVAFHGVSKSAVTCRDYNFEQIRADREVRRNSQNINHRRHSDVTGAAAEESAEQS